MTADPDIHALTWADFDAAVARLLGLAVQGSTGVYGVPRGGLVLAVALSYALDLPLVPEPDRKTLIVGDITGTGKTLSAWPDNQRVVWVRRWGAHCRTSAATYLPLGDDRWVVFPWESRDRAMQDKAAYEVRSA